MKDKIIELMTPKELLLLEEFDPAEIISPDNCNGFDCLLKRRSDITNLKLLPIKLDNVRALYREDRDKLIGQLTAQMGCNQLMYAINEYPYFLPQDVSQGLIWVVDGATEEEVISFIADQLDQLNVSPYDVILFERSRVAKTKMVRGSFPSMRHIHLWTRK